MARLMLSTMVGLALGTIALNQALAADINLIAGEYACVGSNPDGEQYTGKVVIARRGEVFEFRWTIESGETYRGVGLLQGDVLAVSFGSRDAAGVVAYSVTTTGNTVKLLGRWAELGGASAYKETLTRNR